MVHRLPSLHHPLLPLPLALTVEALLDSYENGLASYDNDSGNLEEMLNRVSPNLPSPPSKNTKHELKSVRPKIITQNDYSQNYDDDDSFDSKRLSWHRSS